MSSLRRLASQTALYGLSSVVGRMLNFLLVPWYTRLFVPAEYGVVTDWYALVSFLNVVYGMGMETAYFRHHKQHPNTAYGSAYATVALNAAALSSLFLLLAPSLAVLMQYPGHPEYVRWFALILLFDALVALPFARLRLEERALRFALLRLLSIGINILCNLFFLLICPAWQRGGMDCLS